MAGTQLRVLLVDDDEEDFILTRSLCSRVRGIQIELEWVPTYDRALHLIAQNVHDAYLIDFSLGARTGVELIEEVFPCCDAPLILLTGHDDRAFDLKAMSAGAADYLVKDEISGPLLERAIRYSIERKRTERRLNQLALYDSLTGLANRSLCNDRLNRAVSRASRYGHKVALLFIDLDRFKAINDAMGHEAGDQLLVAVAGRIRRCAREVDTVARLGGDEFVVILDVIDERGAAESFATRVLDLLRQPFVVGGQDIHVTASIGITIFPSDTSDPAELLRNADMAMYAAKEGGKNLAHFYRSEMALVAAKRARLESRLRYALKRDEYIAFYQPQIDMRSRRMVGAEALLRWQYANDTIVGPAEFLDILEETAMIVEVGDWVLRTACMAFMGWQQEAGVSAPKSIAINVSRLQFRRGDIADRIIGIVRDTGIDPEAVELELTESSLVSDPEMVRKRLTQLVDAGIRIALDDFGTGYSSLNCLHQFPLHRLKIDKSFVDHIGESQNKTLAQVIINMAHTLDLEVVAEGVETEEQARFLINNGCHLVQGYFYARPTPPSEITGMFDKVFPAVVDEEAAELRLRDEPQS